MTNWVWRTGLEEPALRRDKEIMMQKGVVDALRVAIPKEIAAIRMEIMKASKMEDEWLPHRSPGHSWWNNQLKAGPRAEGFGHESYQRHLESEFWMWWILSLHMIEQFPITLTAFGILRRRSTIGPRWKLPTPSTTRR